MTDWTIITRSLRTRLFSTVTTVVTVAVAVALMLILIMMRSSASQAFVRGSGNMHMLVSRDQSALVSVLNGIFYSAAPRNYMLITDYEKIAASFPLDYAIPLQLGDSYKARWPVMATYETFFSKFQPAPNEKWAFLQGRPFAKEFEIVVGSTAARQAGVHLGDKLILTHGVSGGAAAHEHSDYAYEVVGILASTGTPHDRALFTDLNSTWIIHAHDRKEREEAAQREAKRAKGEKVEEKDHEHEAPTTIADLIPEDRKITDIYLRVATRAGSDASASQGPVFAALRANPTLMVAEPKKEMDKLLDIVSNVNQILVAMAVVVMVSSGIAIMVALYNSMEQRRRQIAVLRVLGASQMRIFGLVVTESAVIGILGAIAGIALSIAGAWVVAEIMKRRLQIYIDPAVPLDAVALVGIAAIALAGLAGLVPAVMAYRTSVARNLRPLG